MSDVIECIQYITHEVFGDIVIGYQIDYVCKESLDILSRSGCGSSESVVGGLGTGATIGIIFL